MIPKKKNRRGSIFEKTGMPANQAGIGTEY
jgi:hypothetical protein